MGEIIYEDRNLGIKLVKQGSYILVYKRGAIDPRDVIKLLLTCMK